VGARCIRIGQPATRGGGICRGSAFDWFVLQRLNALRKTRPSTAFLKATMLPCRAAAALVLVAILACAAGRSGVRFADSLAPPAPALTEAHATAPQSSTPLPHDQGDTPPLQLTGYLFEAAALPTDSSPEQTTTTSSSSSSSSSSPPTTPFHTATTSSESTSSTSSSSTSRSTTSMLVIFKIDDSDIQIAASNLGSSSGSSSSSSSSSRDAQLRARAAVKARVLQSAYKPPPSSDASINSISSSNEVAAASITLDSSSSSSGSDSSSTTTTSNEPTKQQQQAADQIGQSQQLPPAIQQIEDFEQLPITLVTFSTAAALAAMHAHPSVAAVVPDRFNRRALVESLPLIRQPAAVAQGYDGSGCAVAVLDTGRSSFQAGLCRFGLCRFGWGQLSGCDQLSAECRLSSQVSQPCADT